MITQSAPAHIQVSPAAAAPGDSVQFELLVPDERQAHTIEVALKIPGGVLAFSFEDNPRWHRVVEKGRDGSVSVVRWHGDLPSGAFARFARRSRAAGPAQDTRVDSRHPAHPQLGQLLREHKLASPFSADHDYVFAPSRGTPLGHRNVQRRALESAAKRAGLADDGWPPLRFHDLLRHTFASDLIIDLGLDVAQVSRILGHAHITTTLDVYTRVFDQARHAAEIRARMAASAFAQLLIKPTRAIADGEVVALAGTRAT